MRKNQSGITLLALVITVVVILILSVIAVTATLGDKGVLRKAQQAQNDFDARAGEQQQRIAEIDSRRGSNTAYVEIISIDSTTNTATVVFETKYADEYRIYVTPSGGEEIEVKRQPTTDGEKTETIPDLKQGTEYKIRIEAYYKDRKKAETYDYIKTKVVMSLTTADLTFTYNPNTWTNDKVVATAKVKDGVNISGFTLQTSKDGNTWNSVDNQTYTENGIVYARLVDSSGQEGGSTTGNVDKIDKVPPTNTAPDASSTAPTSLVATFKQTDALSGIPDDDSHKWYRLTNAAGTTGDWVADGAATHTFTGLSGGTQYYVQTKAKDRAGNEQVSAVTLVTSAAQPVTSIAVSPTAVTIVAGNNTQITATVTPNNASNKGVTWTSSNTNVATVSTAGVVTGKSAGTATITATAADGSGKKATCTVTVQAAIAKTNATTNPYHASMQSAVNACTAGGTVTLLVNHTEHVTIGKTLTIDLGGKTLHSKTGPYGSAIEVHGTKGTTLPTVTVKNGILRGDTNKETAIHVQYGNTVISGVTIYGYNSSEGSWGAPVYASTDATGTITMNSGTITGGGMAVYLEGGHMIVNGGTITGVTGGIFVNNTNVALTINGGTITGQGFYGIGGFVGSTVNLYAGTVSGKEWSVYFNPGKIRWHNTTVKSTNHGTGQSSFANWGNTTIERY